MSLLRSIRDSLRSVAAWALMFVTILVMSPWYLLRSVFDPGGVRIYPISTQYLRFCAFYIGLKIEAQGIENVPPRGPVIVMANHRSWWDIPAIWLGIYPRQLRFVAKKELAHVPVLGWCIRQGGHILIDRNDRESAIRTLRRVAERFAGRFSLVLFPEGTRARDWRLLPFKRGGFHLARQLDLPIVPVSVTGGERIMKKGSLNLYPGVMRVQFHAPVAPSEYPDNDALSAAVRARIAAGLARLGEYEPDREAGR